MLAVAFPLLLLPAVASAQGATDNRAVARQLAKEGHEALGKKDYATAADRFARADAIVHAPTLMLGLAQADVGLGKLVAAAELYNRILLEGVPAGSPPPFFQALQDARTELAALDPRVAGLIIRVKGAASRVTLDGAVVPAAALGAKRPVEAGRHVIRAEGESVAPAEVDVMVAGHNVESVTLELKSLDQALSAAPAPGGEGPAPGSTQRALGAAATAIGGAGVVMGAITGGLALSKRSQLAAACPVANRCKDSAIGGYNTMGTLSTAGFIAGGAVAVTGIILLATAPRARVAPSARVTPMIGPGWVGAEGTF
jgi:hypothetical protein